MSITKEQQKLIDQEWQDAHAVHSLLAGPA